MAGGGGRPPACMKPLFAGASDRPVLHPVTPRGAPAGATRPASGPPPLTGPTVRSSAGGGGLSAGPLVQRLHTKFCRFQVQAKQIEQRVADTQMPVDSGMAVEVLEQYSRGVAAELRRARDELRRGKWDIDAAVRADHDTLCFCLAVWELTHEVAVSDGPSASRVLQWYNRHYLEEDIAEWWQKASTWAGDDEALKPDSPFWEPLCRLALADCRQEVLELLGRSAEAADKHVARICEFLRGVPSVRQMDEARASRVEYREAMGEIQSAASAILSETPLEHPGRRLLRVYAGCSQMAFEDSKDIGAEMGRTWVEDVVYVHAWVFPELRKTELGDLLRAVARRRTTETVDDVDRALFAVLNLDVPGLLRILGTLPDRFPGFFVTHLVDVLYFAGRVPYGAELEGQPGVPPRDWQLMAYAQEFLRGPRQRQRLAVDYLRAGGCPAARRLLALAADQYCAAAATDEELEEAMTLLLDLDLAVELGPRHCRLRARERRVAGDVVGCFRWVCKAESYSSEPRGFYVSEVLDSFAENEEELEALLAALTPDGLDEPLDRYPPASLRALLAPAGPAPSGRLYLLVQYARCRALRRAGQPAEAYAPTLVRLLTSGTAPPRLARAILAEDLLPVLREKEGAPGLNTEEALLLMRFVQAAGSDPLRRCPPAAAVDPLELHRALGACLSRAILRGSGKCGGTASWPAGSVWPGRAS